jgi:DNA-binding MarR family transcriptional regulator
MAPRDLAAPDGALPAPASVPADLVRIERELTRVSHMTNRARRHERLMAEAGVPLDRAAVMVLRRLADSGPLRPGELAVQLAVEAPHVTRQVQRLEKGGYVDRVPDPDDRRAQLVRLTPAGRDAVARVREAALRVMHDALAHWSPEDLARLATLFGRMVDDFLAYGAAQDEAAASRAG